MEQKLGKIYRISGPVVIAKELDAKMYDVVLVSKEQLMGEVIQINGDKITIQVYEDTVGLKPGDIVKNTYQPLSVELGPGLLGSIYDGIQRPLPELKKQLGDFILRGATAPALDRQKKWKFTASVKKGDKVKAGQMIGIVDETENIKHKIMVSPTLQGTIKDIQSGTYTVEETIGTLEKGEKLTLMQRWPVRSPRPVAQKIPPTMPLITGQRVIDALFPLARGGVAAIPGPFGAGKTVTQQSLAKWAATDIVVYIGCGERGNEMTEVLTEFPELTDPKTGKPLMKRTVLVANTSNMPVAAREASIYTGIAIAEYYRDMGYHVALMADSTSRWAEAMREISARLEEMPGEEGYPAYLSTRLAEFYERAGEAKTQNNEVGSISVIGAVSPPGGDFSEPVTQGTLRVVKAFWGLDHRLSQQRHFPSINWIDSYSLYRKTIGKWFEGNVKKEWNEHVDRITTLLQEEEKLSEIVRLVGSDALAEKEQLILQVARMVRESVLQQNAFHDIDTYCPPEKTFLLMDIILKYYDRSVKALDRGKHLEEVSATKAKDKISEIKFEKDYLTLMKKIDDDMKKEFETV